MNDLLMDIRYSLRVLRKTPTFTIVALLTLVLGIGVNVVVFGVVNAVLLRPLEVSDPDNLYELRLKPWTHWKLLTTSYPAFEDYTQRNTTFTGLTGYDAYSSGRLRWGNAVKNVTGFSATGNYFDLLGVQPQVGRLFHESDVHGPNSAPYMVLSDALWRTAFNADPGIIGATVELNKKPFTVIGVAPPQFHGTERFDWPDYFIPAVNEFSADQLRDRTGHPLTVVGRLKSGVTPQQAAENLSAIAAQLAKEYPKTDTGVPLRLIRPGLHADEGDITRAFFYGVTGLALLVLVAACANLASLFAARAADRSHELALRVSLGASRWRLVRQLFTEAMMLSILGGAVGMATAGFLLGALQRFGLPGYGMYAPHSDATMAVDVRVYVAGVILTLVSGLLFGMIPAGKVWESNPLQALKSGPVDARGRRRLALRDVLLGAQIIICTLLVIASFVAVRGMVRLLNAPLGFQPQGAMVADMDLSEVEGGRMPVEKTQAMIDALRSLPGVTAAGTTSRVPFNGGLRGIPVFPPGTTEFTLKTAVIEPYGFAISPGFLDAARTRLLQGRDVSWRDNTKAPYVAIVNETFARKMWGDTPALGQRFIFLDQLREVVGIVEDGKYHSIQDPPQPAVFVPLSQNERARTVFIVRSPRAPNELAALIEHTLLGFEPNAVITVESWADSNAMEIALFPSRAATVALGIMALLAAVVAMTGIFGMAAYNVSRRMKELGIRVALGARARHVMAAAVGRPIMLLGIGSFVGLLGGLFVSRLLGQIVYQANAGDPFVVAGAILTMALLGLAASAIPARRALAVDPCKLMRQE